MKRSIGLLFKFKVGSVPSIKAPTVSVVTTSSTTTAPLQPDGVGCSTSQAVGIEKTEKDPRKLSGGAYLKRERARVLKNFK